MVDREGYLNKIVELQEQIAHIPCGSIGKCTADLEDYYNDGEDRFAVQFSEHGWITFTDSSIRNKFKIIED